MICSKRYFYLLVFALVGSFFISLLTNANDSFALEPLVFNVTSTVQYPCDTCYSQGYRFLKIEVSGSGSASVGAYYNGTSSTSFFYPWSSPAYISVPSSGYFRSFGNSSSTVTMTFLDSLPSDVVAPSGSLSITENGTYDVSSYAEAVVDVPAQVIQGDYHDDLTSINQSILLCGAVLLVLYFFYCIYRMIIKSTGGIQ